MTAATAAREFVRRTGALQALPEEAPLAMPVQTLGRHEGPQQRPTTGSSLLPLARLFVIGGAAAMTGVFAYEMYRVLEVGGLTVLEGVVLGLFVLLSGWISFSFTSAVAGVPGLLRSRPPLGLDAIAPLEARTALLLPTYNEAPARVFAGLQATLESLDATGHGASFDAFVLSDTTDADVWVAEEAEFLALRARSRLAVRVYYRHRERNTDRKAGNIGEWVRRFGAAYRSMIVLDADSLMSGDTIVRLAAAMDRHPSVGLIQTLPTVVGGRTLFARCQQFAGRLYGPLLAHGLAAWHGSESNYWGHNAIIRTEAFASAAGLPHLRGGPPLGGHILSHDFVEAALIRRAGWGVHMVPDLGGSYEEGPPALADVATRDRRWCQGNLQHAGVLPARGLHWVSRLHLLTGIGSYITAPLWLAMLLVGLMVSLQARFVPPDYFPAAFSLFPTWPAQDPVRAAWVFVATMGLLMTPKLIAVLVALASPRRGFGASVVPGMLVETLLTGLVAPVMMVIQSGFILDILRGRDSGWRSQRRVDGSVPLGQTLRLYGPATVMGAGLAAAAYAIAPALFLWMTPVIAGLLLAVPVAALAGRRGPGTLLRRLGLLVTPEEAAPPPELRRLAELLAERPPSEPPEAIARLAADEALLAAHRDMLPDGGSRRRGDVSPERLIGRTKVEDAQDLREAVSALSPRERTAVIGDDVALHRLMSLAAAQSTARRD